MNADGCGDGRSGMKAVVFDFGGVMTTNVMPERVKAYAESEGIPWSALEEGFAKYRHDYDGGFITIGEMYAKIWADAGLEVASEVHAKILEEDAASWLYRNERTLEWMRKLRSQGLKIGILTNMAPDFAVKFRETFADFIALADAMVISGEERLFKPQLAIYELLASRLGLPGNELLFIDDVEENCDGARRAGWTAIRFRSNEQVESDFLHGLWK